MRITGVLRGARALALATLAIVLPRAGLHAQSGDTLPPARWLTTLPSIGGPVEDRSRLRQLLGEERTDGFLIRSPSSRAAALPERGVRWAVVAPEVDLAWNSDLPFSLNDGPLWAGRGANVQATAGVHLRAGRVSLLLAPQLTYSANRDFQTIPPDSADRSTFSSPWYRGHHSADLPLRFGDRPLVQLHPGQTTLMVEAGRGVVVGASTENQWWGPGMRNAIVLSNQAAGIPHLFARTAEPLRTRYGSVEGKWILGGMTESLYFDTLSANDVRSLSGFAATFRPAAQPDLTLGVARVVYAGVDGAGRVPLHLLDVFTRWERPEPAPPDSLLPEGASPPQGSGREQILSLFGRWVFPQEGFEVYGEWARVELPGSFVDLVNEPNHTQGYTLGVQWARPVREGSLFRLQSELTYLEESATYDNRPTPLYYVSRAVPQGYTHRGQVVGAGIGPGGSGQWLAGDYLSRRWSLGLFGGRIRWNNDVYYDEPGRIYAAHDVSVFGGARTGVSLPGVHLQAEYAVERRYNYLFQNPEAEPEGRLAVDVWNRTLRIALTPRVARGRR